MSDDVPNYSRRIVRRRQVVPVVSTVSGVLAVLSSAFALDHLLALLGAPPSAWLRLFVMPAAAGIGIVVGIGVCLTTHHLHRHLWPEHPDEE